MVQYGFFFDQSRCTGCKTCTIACKTWNQVPPGPVKYMRVLEWEEGTWPQVRVHFVAVPCYHCENPKCADACPAKAIIKEDKYGAVLIDEEYCNPSAVKCGRACWDACPYGSILFASDNLEEKAQKCTMCIDRLEQGVIPICVASCPMRALDFGPIEELAEKYGRKFKLTRRLEGMPSPEEVKPAVVMKERDPHREVVPYNAGRAVELWGRRGPYAPPDLPPVLDLKDMSVEGVEVGRSKPVFKPKRAEQLMYYTTNDE
ncbi:MAG: 4Fe-4S dicluster domain-containing protein [Candidatus Nezhaarchaeota archaeon]|nr:4Fe-4S dicluster domain-containing protein [Candidatus Nezhaarchaeota archaeon]